MTRRLIWHSLTDFVNAAYAEKFKREHSQVGVNLVVENTRRCCQAVARGELDFAVVGGKIPPDVKHLLLVSKQQALLSLHPSLTWPACR